MFLTFIRYTRLSTWSCFACVEEILEYSLAFENTNRSVQKIECQLFRVVSLFGDCRTQTSEKVAFSRCRNFHAKEQSDWNGGTLVSGEEKRMKNIQGEEEEEEEGKGEGKEEEDGDDDDEEEEERREQTERDEKKRGLRKPRARVDPAYGQRWSARAPCQGTADGL